MEDEHKKSMEIEKIIRRYKRCRLISGIVILIALLLFGLTFLDMSDNVETIFLRYSNCFLLIGIDGCLRSHIYLKKGQAELNKMRIINDDERNAMIRGKASRVAFYCSLMLTMVILPIVEVYPISNVLLLFLIAISMSIIYLISWLVYKKKY